MEARRLVCLRAAPADDRNSAFSFAPDHLPYPLPASRTPLGRQTQRQGQKAHLKSIGGLQGEFDILIGSTALAYGLTLATRNTRHFANIANLVLEDWIAIP